MRNTLESIMERRDKILEIISLQDEVSVDFLSRELSVTNVTIRKDLDYLSQQGKLIRFSGGARSLSAVNSEIPDTGVANMQDTVVHKRCLARTAAELLSTDDVVLINSSSTASYVVEYTGSQALTIITNNIPLLSRKRNPNAILILTGGQVLPGRDSLSGTYTTEIISRNHATKCIIGARGISVSGGITSTVLEEATINRLMVEQTVGTVIAVASSEKINRIDSFHVCDISEIDILVTDSKIRPEDKRAFEDAGLQVIIADDPE